MKPKLPDFRAFAFLVLLASLPLALETDGADARIMAVAPPGDAPDGTMGKGGLHLPRDKKVNFTYEMRDGGGFRWDVQYYGNIGQGTNYAYSSGLYSQYNGTNISSNGWGWLGKDGDEVEIGPYRIGNLNCYRRVKVYKDMPIARWIDIFENTTGSDQSVSMQVQSNMNYMLTGIQVPGGGTSFGEKDWAFITETQGGNNVPSLLHIVCDQRSKVRPRVNTQSNTIMVRYDFSVPAGGAAAICYFESQNNSIDEQKKTLASFKASKMLKDLSPAVRKLILNFAARGGLADIELERLEDADQILQPNGDPLKGAIKNEQFSMTTFYGKMPLPAKEVVGMVAGVTEDEPFQAVLVDGQVICGQLDKGEKLQLDLPTGGTLSVPLGKVSQWAYRISSARPDDTTGNTAILVLRTGDRLGFDPASLKLSMRTQHGTVPLSGKELLEVTLDNTGNGVHRAVFVNGSVLAGFLEPEKLDLTVKLGPRLSISRDLVAQIRFGNEEKSNPALSQASLTNGDELMGELTDQTLSLETEFNPALPIKPSNVKSMVFNNVHLGRVTLEMWDGTVLRGQLAQPELSWQIVPGPTLKLAVCQIGKITRVASQPPGELKAKVEKLIANLGAESYLDRQSATDELLKEGKKIIPILQEHARDGDPEVRQRIEDILEKLGAKAPDNTQPPQILEEGEINMPMPALQQASD